MKSRKEIGVSERARHKQMLAYILADAFESAWTDHKDALERDGLRLAFTTKKAANDIMRGFREIHRVARGSKNETDQKVQECIGTMGDITLAIVALCIDRCDSDEGLFKLYCDIKNRYRSKVGMKLDNYEHNAFGEL